jgi:hypothetical protein
VSSVRVWCSSQCVVTEGADLYRVVAHVVTPAIAGVVHHYRACSTPATPENLSLGFLVVDRERPIVSKGHAQAFVFKFLFLCMHLG